MDFRGLPIPGAAGVLASIVYLVEDFSIKAHIPLILIAALSYVLAFLMVSTIRYKSFKDLSGPLIRPFRVLVGVVLALFVAAAIPQVVACLAFVGYAASGPYGLITRWRKTKRESALENFEGTHSETS